MSWATDYAPVHRSLYCDTGNNALVTGKSDIDILDMIKNRCRAADGVAQVFRLHGDPVVISADRHLTVQSLFVPFLPAIPSHEIRSFFNLYPVFNMLIGSPVFAIQPKQESYPSISLLSLVPVFTLNLLWSHRNQHDISSQTKQPAVSFVSAPGRLA